MASGLWNDSKSFNSSTINETTTNTTDNTMEMLYTVSFTVNISLSTVTCVLLVMLYMSLHRCKRLPIQIKWLSCNFVFGEVIVMIAHVSITLWLDSADEDTFETIYRARTMSVGALFLVAWTTTVGFVFERLITLSRPFHFQNWLNRRNCAIFLALNWVVNFVAPSCVFVLSMVRCYPNYDACDLAYLFDIVRVFFAVVIATYTLIILVASLKISRIVRMHVKQINTMTHSSTSLNTSEFQITRALLKLVLAYTLLHLPLVFHGSIFILKPALQVKAIQQPVNVVSFVCFLLSSHVSLYLYIWKIPECRMNFLLLYCFWSEKRKQEGFDLKMKVFNMTFLNRQSISEHFNI